MTPDPRIDAYIAKAAPFARPVLTHLRGVVRRACPAAEEAIKWGMPTYMYKGKMLCGMAAFKAHAAFGIWQRSSVIDPKDHKGADAMGQMGRLTSVRDLPPVARLTRYLRAAAALIDQGVVRPRPVTRKPPARMPADLKRALDANRKAKATFAALSPTGRRDYVEWITGAKTDATRTRRLATSIEWLNDGKTHNWRYEQR